MQEMQGKPGSNQNSQGQSRGGGGGDAGSGAEDGAPTMSPFASVSATMGWETFHLVQILWMSQVDVPKKVCVCGGGRGVLLTSQDQRYVFMLLQSARQAGRQAGRGIT